ncbi:MAG TPA: type II secretion system F family protein [Bacilli bacterium]|nr:type II secretion system F family protein [Bacilli bacterium]HQC83944.1 type II secretion system F family protein [Bacilli bacterium]
MNYTHKQDNFFLFFFVYVCLGVYYILNTLAMPFIFIWNALSNGLYNSVNTKVNTGDLSGAYLNETEASALSKKDEDVSVAPTTTVKKEVRISTSLLESREALINSIDAQNEIRSDRPLTYRYVALNPDGEQVTNTFIAYSKVEVYTFLENEGYKVFKIENNKWIERMYGANAFISRKISMKNIVFWLDQLSTYLKAGIPLTDAMRILSKQMGKNDNIKRTFDSVVYNLTLGESFSSSLEKQGEAFPPLLVNMIKSAEATGDLEGTLDDMANYYRETENTRKEMISALTYPALVLVFAIGVIVFILVYLIPQFINIYNTAGVALNPMTTFIISMSNFLRANLFYIIVVIAIIVTTITVLYKNVKAFRYSMQVMMMKMPLFGKLIIYKEITIFTKTFASLLKNNVFITESMDILGKVTSNEVYREIMINTINCIGRGEKISSSFKDNWAIPEVAYYMMVTGESTGKLDEMMEKVSEYYSEQHKVMVNSMKTLIEPILIIFLAVVVGGIIISVIVPIFSLYQNIQ